MSLNRSTGSLENAKHHATRQTQQQQQQQQQQATFVFQQSPRLSQRHLFATPANSTLLSTAGINGQMTMIRGNGAPSSSSSSSATPTSAFQVINSATPVTIDQHSFDGK